jgi:sugar phosphate isomerase/epimerase
MARVFISVKLNQDDGAAAQLKKALEDAGVTVYLCNPRAGDNLDAEIAAALDACELFVVLGTEHYGVQGDSPFSTRQELQFAISHNKPIFLIKRWDEFADPLTRLYLPAGMFHKLWPPHAHMPEGLVDEIRAKLNAPRAAAASDHIRIRMPIDSKVPSGTGLRR